MARLFLRVGNGRVLLIRWLRRQARPLFVAVLLLAPLAAEATTVTGTVNDASGTPLASGRIILQLSQEGTVTDPALLLIQPMVSCTITNGAIAGGCTVRGNDTISPAGTFYRVRILTASGQVLLPARSYAITGATWDIGTVTPLASETVAAQAYQIVQDEGTNQPQQTKLNFTGAGVSCADDPTNSRTNCTITGGGGGGAQHQVDGVNLLDNLTVNFRDTPEILFSNPTLGNIDATIAAGGVTDAMLASSYSGIGACPADQFAVTLNDNLAPTCAQVNFANLAGAATDAQVPDTITLTNITQIANRAITDTTGNLPVSRLDGGAAPAVSYDLALASLEIPNSITLPATCNVGQVYHDTDAALGARLYLCTALNTWTAVDNPFGTAIDIGELSFDPILETELDTEAELEAQIADMANIIQATEIDTTAELADILTDDEGNDGGFLRAAFVSPAVNDVVCIDGVAPTSLGNCSLDPAYDVIAEEGTPVTERSRMNFIGPAVTVTDDAVTPETDVAIVASGVGACAADQFVTTLTDGAAPTCTQPAFSNLSGAATKAQLPAAVAYEDEANIFTVAGGLTMDNQLGLRLRELTANGTQFVEIRGPASIVTSATYTWNITGDCTGNLNAGALTIDASKNIICSDDDGGAGGSGDAIEVEDGDNLGTFTPIDTTARLEDQGDINFVFTDGGAGGPDTITALVRADSVALTTDTTGNYVASLSNGTGLTGFPAAGEGATGTPAFDFSDAGADPALGAGECRFSNEGVNPAGWVCEGETADLIETRFRVTDPTTADRIITFPDAGGEVTLLGQTIEAAEFTPSFSGVGDCGAGNFARRLNDNAAPTCAADDDVPEAGDYTALSGGDGIVHSPTGTLAVDLNATLDGVGLTSSLSGMEFTATNELALLQGCVNNEILKWVDAAGSWDCAADATGGSPSWDSIANPAGNQALAMGANTTTHTFGGAGTWTASFEAAFAGGVQFLIRQQTGNPTGGTLFGVQAADAQVTPLVNLGNLTATIGAEIESRDTVTDNTSFDSPSLAFTARYDSDPTVGATDAQEQWAIVGNVTQTNVAEPTSQLDFNVDGATPASILDTGVVNVTTGFTIGGAAASGNYLRGNATNFVSSAIQAGDLPAHDVACATNPCVDDAEIVAALSRDTEAPGAGDISGSLSAGYTINAGAVASAELAAANKQFIHSIDIFDPTTADTNKIQHKFAQAITLQRVSCSTLPATSTVTIQFDERAEGTPNTAGTNVLTANLICDDTSEATVAFANAGIAADAPLNLQIVAVANTPTIVRIHLDFQID